jgi:hypothetical protein
MPAEMKVSERQNKTIFAVSLQDTPVKMSRLSGGGTVI